ncbi:Ubiquitin carboxyl-terminal hydrolase isozyme L5 [Smittium culicis]|uniref:Ubiquitin carboxyl-terminal hydrolase n=1 Tax=Smittium culicis TaxID=133412 RepID=A0A1R1XQC5_9FUNG|nr:Ubiquitin carboxyl-terminal hydrolase isozyme L5 [Smittium culicis]OMJ16850.1 Ubiquitin carboxyl-terminal hydrolase isozyme L5 [Smittium culicis]
MEEGGNWCLIESDPGVFTELIGNMGVKGVQVEEIYTLDDDFSTLDQVYGIVFLFKWENNKQSSEISNSYEDRSDSNQPIFIKQIVQNACATQALLSILLNHDQIELGPELANLKDFMQQLDPHSRGLVLSNSEVIRQVHNSFARQQLIEKDNDDHSDDSKDNDLFHFVAYIPFNNLTYKLDGLSNGPILVSDPNRSADLPLGWINDALFDIKHKISSIGDGFDIRFNLMALTKDCRISYNSRLEQISSDISALQTKLQQLEINNNGASPQNIADEISNSISRLTNEKLVIENKLHLQNCKLQNYSIENARRKHNFVPMIMLLIKELAKKNLLQQAIDNSKK